jgi:hypothetical protein
MRAVRLSELQELLHGPAFEGWWAELQRATAELAELSARLVDVRSQAELLELRSELAQRAAMDAFSEAGEGEELQARSAAEAQELENRALALVGLYEEQRFRASGLWYRLGAAERALEEAREGLARGAGPEGAEATALALEKQRRTMEEEYEAEDRKRSALWAEVEGSWASSFERSLLSHEHADGSRRVRREAERHIKEAEERRVRARQLRGELELATRERDASAARRARLLDRARQELGCAAGERFLYWRDADDKRAAFAVALVDDPESYNLRVKALAVYSVGPQRGVTVLEPAREGRTGAAGEGDRRFEDLLLGPRRGLRRGGDGTPPGDPSGTA